MIFYFNTITIHILLSNSKRKKYLQKFAFFEKENILTIVLFVIAILWE